MKKEENLKFNIFKSFYNDKKYDSVILIKSQCCFNFFIFLDIMCTLPKSICKIINYKTQKNSPKWLFFFLSLC